MNFQQIGSFNSFPPLQWTQQELSPRNARMKQRREAASHLRLVIGWHLRSQRASIRATRHGVVVFSPHGARTRSHSGSHSHRKERRREKSPGPGQRSLLETGEETGRMSRRKSETLLFCPGAGRGGGREEKREEKRRDPVKHRQRSGGNQRRLSVPSLVLDQAESSLNKLTLGRYQVLGVRY